MAKAEKILLTEPGVRLDMTKEEAENLFIWLDKWGGDTLEDIHHALSNVLHPDAPYKR